ncbi:hypothetical protein JCM8547_006163 [Rhodosporidiobolus lusitaniae]
MLRLRSLVSYLLAALALLLLAFALLRDSFDSASVHNALWAPGSVQRGGSAGAQELLARTKGQGDEGDLLVGGIAKDVLHGGVVMPRLPNATAKAELGRASWKLLHTMAARFPETPTADERETFRLFIYLFSRLYPCGECAAEFQLLLRSSPPQTSSRSSASMWLCSLHNRVNDRLGKPEFDCSADLEGVYDCGCRGLDGDELEVGEKGRIGTRKGEGAKVEARAEEEEEGEREAGRVEPLLVNGERTDPQTGLELIGG